MLLCQSIFSFKLVTGLVVYVYPSRYTGFGIGNIVGKTTLLYAFAWASVGFTLLPGLITPARAALYVLASSLLSVSPSALAPVSVALYAAACASSGVIFVVSWVPASLADFALTTGSAGILPPKSLIASLYLANCSAVNVVSTLALIAPLSRELYAIAFSALKALSALKILSFTASLRTALIFSASSRVMFVGIPGSNFITLNLLKSTKLNESSATLLLSVTPAAFIRALLGVLPFSSPVTLPCVLYNKSVLNDIIILCTFSSWLNTILSAI